MPKYAGAKTHLGVQRDVREELLREAGLLLAGGLWERCCPSLE